MRPEAGLPSERGFSGKVPPRSDVRADYAPDREYILLWVNLTTLPVHKHGPAIIGRLKGKENTGTKTLSTTVAYREGGGALILERL